MDVTRVFELIDNQLELFPKNDALGAKINGQWTTYSTQYLKETADKISLGLLKLGLAKEDKVSIVSFNRPEWNFVDYGTQQIGAITVPLYPTITIDDYRYILTEAEVKIIFVSTADLYEKVTEATQGLIGIQGIYTFDEVPGAKNWKELLTLAEGDDTARLKTYRDAVQPDDLLTLIYTSGTTGHPKGVMLTHNNLVSNFKACKPLMPVANGDKALSFLPLCHVYERMLNYLYAYCGVSIYYAESLETIADNLKEVKPEIFVSVPRLLEKVYDRIYGRGQDLTGIKRMLFFWALELGLKYEFLGKNGFIYELQLKLANKLIFSKWREALGGNVKAVVSGGAALQPRLARVFWAARIPVMEGYGLTETSPVICVNRCQQESNRIGTVGPVIDGVQVKIAEDGEILAKGPNIMKGYYKKPEQTAEVIDADGWFHTGDIGEWYEGRFLKITDRKKEMFKTSGGKYIAPQQMENKFKEIKLLEQVMVVGDGMKFPAALIVPNFVALKDYCDYKGIPYSTNEQMISNPAVLEKFQREVDEKNEHFAQYEKIKKFALLPKLWTIEAGELTPKLSVKRKVILQRYKDTIDKMYEN